MRNGIDERVKVEGWQIRILCLDEHHIRCVVPRYESIVSGLGGFYLFFNQSLTVKP